MSDLIKQDNSLSTNRLFDQIKTTEQESTWWNNFISKNTKRGYLYAVKEFCQFLGIENKEDLRRTEPGHVIAYRDFLKKNKKSDRTISTRLSALSSLFDDLVISQIMSTNPARGVKRPHIEHTKVVTHHLSEQEKFAMLEGPDRTTLPGLRDWVLLSILFGTGCRRSEVSQLRVKDNYTIDSYPILKFKVKGGKENEVWIPTALQSRINEYLGLAGHGDNPESPLLLTYSKNGLGDGSMSSNAVSDIWKKYRVDSLSTPHSSRATFATEAIGRGEDLIRVQQTLAHADPRTTLKYNKATDSFKNGVAAATRI